MQTIIDLGFTLHCKLSLASATEEVHRCTILYVQLTVQLTEQLLGECSAEHCRVSVSECSSRT